MSDVTSAGTGGDAVVTGYARALLEVAQAEGVLERVEDELYRVARTFADSPALEQRLTDPALDSATKLDVIHDLLSGRAHPLTVSAVVFVVESGRARQLAAIFDRYVELAAEQRQLAVAEVRTAYPLDPERAQRLAAAVSRATGRKVTLKVTVDSSVVGGVVVRIGDTVIDGSVARRLSELRSRLVGA